MDVKCCVSPRPAAELQSILEPFLLRRVKSEVAVDLPKKTEVVVYHGMSALQKKYYKALLMKDVGEIPFFQFRFAQRIPHKSSKRNNWSEVMCLC